MIKKLIEIIKEDIIGTDNRVMAIAWLICLSGLIGVGFYLSSESRSFLGVADSREQQVSFAYPVEIKQLHVIAGQKISKGELLIELNQNELSEKIHTAQAILAKLKSEKSVRQHLNGLVNNRTELDAQDPLMVEIDDLTEQLEILEEQRKQLYVFATVDGIVAAVNYKKGEKVSSFAPILTLSPESPTYVEGFIHESLHTKLEIGETVNVMPLSSGTAAIEGKVASVGSRIILIPTRLMNYPNMQVYGREVMIQIPEKNNLLLGEKVQIRPRITSITMSQAIASNKDRGYGQALTKEPVDMQIPISVSKHFQFEPSGAIYLADLKKYVVISDDTDKKKSATLFLVNANGAVDEQTLVVPDVGEISDFESISQSEDHIYLLTSLSLNKKGKEKAQRNQFIRVKRKGLSLVDAEKVNLRELLIKAITTSKAKDLKEALSIKTINELEVESHFTRGQDLYLGLKNPVTASARTLILKIENFESLFSNNTLNSDQVSLWRQLDFKKVDGLPHHLSDLVSVDDVLFAATVCASEQCGAVWKMQDKGGELQPQLIRFYDKAKPEGIAYDSKEKNLFITFDKKDTPAKFALIPLWPANETTKKVSQSEK